MTDAQMEAFMPIVKEAMKLEAQLPEATQEQMGKEMEDPAFEAKSAEKEKAFFLAADADGSGGLNEAEFFKFIQL